MNKATKTIVSTMGVVLGISGMNHGFFETLQGYTPTNGLIIQAIGDAQQMWVHGTEEAFTIIPNFLITGILAMLVGLVIVVWSLFFVHKKGGPAVFIGLFVVLFLVGGGIGQIVFFIPAWLLSTRIHSPLPWWRKVLPQKTRRVLAKLWPVTLAVATVSFLIALEMAIFGFFPGMSDPDATLYLCWSFLLGGLVLFLITFVAGFGADLQTA